MSNSSLVKFELKSGAAIAFLNVEKILDEAIIQNIEDSINNFMENNIISNVVIDFSKVHFLTSSFLGFLIRLNKKLDQQDGQMRLCGIDENIQGIFRITRLDKIFDIHADVEKALLSIGLV